MKTIQILDLKVSKDYYNNIITFVVIHGITSFEGGVGLSENIAELFDEINEPSFISSSTNYKTIQIHKNLNEYKLKKFFMSNNQQNMITQGTTLNGDIISEGDFRVEGRINGSLKTSGKIVVGKTGMIDGSIDAENADFEGGFTGKLKLNGTLVLRSSAYIEGEVSISKLSVEPGATFNATCSMENGVKELSIKEEIESSERKQHNFIIYSQLALQMLIVIGGGVFLGIKLDEVYPNSFSLFYITLFFSFYHHLYLLHLQTSIQK